MAAFRADLAMENAERRKSAPSTWTAEEWGQFSTIGSLSLFPATQKTISDVFDLLDADKSGMLCEHDLRVMPDHIPTQDISAHHSFKQGQLLVLEFLIQPRALTSLGLR